MARGAFWKDPPLSLPHQPTKHWALRLVAHTLPGAKIRDKMPRSPANGVPGNLKLWRYLEYVPARSSGNQSQSNLNRRRRYQAAAYLSAPSTFSPQEPEGRAGREAVRPGKARQSGMGCSRSLPPLVLASRRRPRSSASGARLGEACICYTVLPLVAFSLAHHAQP